VKRSIFSPKRILVGLVAAAALMGAALPSMTLAQSAPAVNIIEPSATDIMNWGVDTPNVTIAAGQSVVWTNTGAQTHTVTADDGSFDSGDIASGGTYSLEFDTPGTFTYHCTPHPWMKATVTVTGS